MDYEEWCQQVVICLESIRRDGVRLARTVIGENLCKEDLYIIGIIDKCLRLIDGFVIMLKERNLTCMGILLRIQIDNCMRTYAIYTAENINEIIDSILDSEIQLNKLKAKDGSRMTDQYLRQQLEKIDERFGTVYKATSGFIHYSEKSFFSIVSVEEPNVLEFDLGHPLNSKNDALIHECTEAFLYFIQFQYDLTQPFVESKKRFDANIEKNYSSISKE